MVKIKPGKTVQLGWALYCSIVFTVVFLVLSIISIFFSKYEEDWFMTFVMIGGVNILVFSIYFLARICYRRYYIITENEIVGYKGKKEVLRVSRENITELRYRKMIAVMGLLIPWGHIFVDPMCGVLSIRFREGQSEGVRVFNTVKLESLTEEEKASGLKEYCECFTKGDLKKITKLLQLDVKELNKLV